jgi:epoxide hydrolase-like predicted phosphatase
LNNLGKRENEKTMNIRVVIFDLGGVLLEIDWERYREDQQSEFMSEDLRPYEQLNPRMLALLKRLRPAYKLAIISNASSRAAMERKFRLSRLVDLLVFDDEEGVSKPDARIYQLTLESLAARPEETIFVDDKIENVEAARHLGMRGIHFQNARQAVAEIEAVLAE